MNLKRTYRSYYNYAILKSRVKNVKTIKNIFIFLFLGTAFFLASTFLNPSERILLVLNEGITILVWVSLWQVFEEVIQLIGSGKRTYKNLLRLKDEKINFIYTMDYLPKIKLPIKQDNDGFKINSDTVNLGEFLNIKKSDSVIDIGTNNGALLLYCSTMTNGKLIGIDINKKALEFAKENMKINNIDNYLLINEKVQNVFDYKVDVVISNPPYFSDNLKNSNENIKNSRHSDHLDLEDLFSNAKRLLKENGSFYMVNRIINYNRVMALIFKYDFKITRLKFVYDENKMDAISFLIECVNGDKDKLKVEKPVIIKH